MIKERFFPRSLDPERARCTFHCVRSYAMLWRGIHVLSKETLRETNSRGNVSRISLRDFVSHKKSISISGNGFEAGGDGCGQALVTSSRGSRMAAAISAK